MRDEGAERLAAGCGEATGFEEQREHRICLGSSEDRPGRAKQFEVVGGRRGEGRGQRRLELGAHGVQHLADQVVLRGEVVDDDPIADAEPFGDASEGELAQPVVERGGQRPVEDVGLGVLVTHRALIVVITAIMVSQ